MPPPPHTYSHEELFNASASPCSSAPLSEDMDTVVSVPRELERAEGMGFHDKHRIAFVVGLTSEAREGKYGLTYLQRLLYSPQPIQAVL
ncbi:unnamed protein product [Dibothriocephalus latus]|uniref:Uncharacterized protein n=1 Tax=Dibothriocephalus latus TaxID=60516 RepID=A0A3P7NRR0_DIBLA|nr:unnamed protein product [Dibothriocephalus latus]